jgi:hypothetical protein
MLRIISNIGSSIKGLLLPVGVAGRVSGNGENARGSRLGHAA